MAIPDKFYVSSFEGERKCVNVRLRHARDNHYISGYCGDTPFENVIEDICLRELWIIKGIEFDGGGNINVYVE